MSAPDAWPLRHLVLRTPRLELRPDDDAGLLELAEEAHLGVHAPEEMPFVAPWTDAPPADLVRGVLQFSWSQRALLAPDRWRVHFLVRHEGRVIGTQDLSGTDFATTREVSTGSWIGRRHHGRGIGTEMRAAVLQLAFDHLGAVRARSSASADNRASQRVSERLGYRRDGTATVVRRGAATTDVRLVVDPAGFVRPDWRVEVDGLAGCRPLLGIG